MIKIITNANIYYVTDSHSNCSMTETSTTEIIESFEDTHNVEFTPDEADEQTAGACGGTVISGCF